MAYIQNRLMPQETARTLQKKEGRRSFEGPASQRNLAEQCQQQLQKRHSSRTSDDAEAERGEETRYRCYSGTALAEHKQLHQYIDNDVFL